MGSVLAIETILVEWYSQFPCIIVWLRSNFECKFVNIVERLSTETDGVKMTILLDFESRVHIMEIFSNFLVPLGTYSI